MLPLYLLLVVGGGLLIGYTTAPDAWYAALAKPSFTPPNWLFAPAWTFLYVLIALAGWRTHRRGTRPAKVAWWTQLALNFLWSPVFFGEGNIGLALAIVLAMLVAELAFIALAWRRDPVSAALFVPYAAWTAFAIALNAAIWQLNPGL